jgi:hypothetical protein
VESVFPDWFFALLSLCQTTHIKFPDNSVIEKSRFASMGSACTFPVLGLLCWSIILASRDEFLSTSDKVCFSHIVDSLSNEKFGIGVFGDDLIVPQYLVDTVVKNLSIFGFVVNIDKSFTSGSFFESCGVDVLKTYPVTPVKLSATSDEYLTWISTSQSISKLGFWLASDFMVKFTHRKVKRSFPFVQFPYGTRSSDYVCTPVRQKELADLPCLSYRNITVPVLKKKPNFHTPSQEAIFFAGLSGSRDPERQTRKYDSSYVARRIPLPLVNLNGSVHFIHRHAIEYVEVVFDCQKDYITFSCFADPLPFGFDPSATPAVPVFVHRQRLSTLLKNDSFSPTNRAFISHLKHSFNSLKARLEDNACYDVGSRSIIGNARFHPRTVNIIGMDLYHNLEDYRCQRGHSSLIFLSLICPPDIVAH